MGRKIIQKVKFDDGLIVSFLLQLSVTNKNALPFIEYNKEYYHYFEHFSNQIDKVPLYLKNFTIYGLIGQKLRK